MKEVLNFQIDSGADATVISEVSYNSLENKPELCKTNVTLSNPGGVLQCVGQLKTKTIVKNKRFNLNIFGVRRAMGDNLPSRRRAIAMGLLKRIEEVRESMFGSVALLKCVPLTIVLNDTAEPYSANVTRRVPIPLLPKVEKELDRME